MDIIRINGKIFLSQQSFLEKVLKRFYILYAKLVSVTLGSYFKLSTKDSPESDFDRDYTSSVSYSNVVRSLIYVMVCTGLIKHKL